MAKVKDVYPNTPHIPLDIAPMKNAKLSDIWARYDETDSMIISTTGKPMAGVNVYLGDEVYAIAEPRDGNKAVGLYFESWDKYVPGARFEKHLSVVKT